MSHDVIYNVMTPALIYFIMQIEVRTHEGPYRILNNS